MWESRRVTSHARTWERREAVQVLACGAADVLKPKSA